MEDAHDFGWASAKGAYALILCRLEEGKVDWLSADNWTVLEGHTLRKYSPITQLMLTAQKVKMRPKVFYVSTSSLVNVATNLIIRQMVNFTNINVLIAILWAKNFHMHLKIVETSVNKTQKMNKALQLCSA